MPKTNKRYYNFSSSKQPTKGVAHSTPAGGGDMTKAVYDPTNIKGDAFDMDNMTEGTTTKIFTDTERVKLSGIEALAEVNNISDINAAALTGGGVTALHSHTGGGGLTHEQVMSRISLGL